MAEKDLVVVTGCCCRGLRRRHEARGQRCVMMSIAIFSCRLLLPCDAAVDRGTPNLSSSSLKFSEAIPNSSRLPKQHRDRTTSHRLPHSARPTMKKESSTNRPSRAYIEIEPRTVPTFAWRAFLLRRPAKTASSFIRQATSELAIAARSQCRAPFLSHSLVALTS